MQVDDLINRKKQKLNKYLESEKIYAVRGYSTMDFHR